MASYYVTHLTAVQKIPNAFSGLAEPVSDWKGFFFAFIKDKSVV